VRVLSVNLAVPRPLAPGVRGNYLTGIDKHPADGAVRVELADVPGTAGLVGDHIGDKKDHGGERQAVYAFAREDLDIWQQRLGRPLRSGCFGENLTTEGIDVNAARVGSRWRVGETVVLEVTHPRIPCGTFRGFMEEQGWVRRFAEEGRPGTYLRVITAGKIRAGDPIEVLSVPEDEPTIAELFRTLIRVPERAASMARADVPA
jgi:MOSC domain-containing protein YiiM